MKPRALQLALRIDRLADDERAILEMILSRIEQGRCAYGRWNVEDGRDNPRETLMEVLDALNYCAAELVRLGRKQR
jgi:hypothetical protein